MAKERIGWERIEPLWKSGKTAQEVADALGCKVETVWRYVREFDDTYKKVIYSRNVNAPIMPEEIDAFRDNLQIGEPVWVKYHDEHGEIRQRRMRVIEKYRYFCRLEDNKGRKDSLLYVQMVIDDRKLQMVG